MHAFGPTDNSPSSHDTPEVLESAITITGKLNVQEADDARNVSEIQSDIYALEEETLRNRATIAATHAEQERHVVAVREAGRVRPEELWRELEEAPYESSVVNYSTLMFSYELMAEIFDWHMLMGGKWTTTLFVCKRWTTVAYGSPRLWARISVTDHPRGSRYLRGSVICTDLDHLRLVLSRSRSCPLQVELSFLFFTITYRDEHRSTASGPQGIANRIEAVKLILSDQVLVRCTDLVLANSFLPFDYQNATVLPLLSSIRTYSVDRRDHEILFIQSLADLSPALRHIHCDHRLSAENKGVGLWTKRIESYSWFRPTTPCYSLHESPSLRTLGIRGNPVVPLTLPALQILRWSIGTYSALYRITAPHLHTLILRSAPYSSWPSYQPAGSISFPNLRVAIHHWLPHPKVLRMFHTPTLEHLSIMYRSSSFLPSVLLELFDGSTHMPTPKSIHLDCMFTDTTLIAVLGRFPWLEELRVAGTAVRDTFWERLTPYCKAGRQGLHTMSPTDGRATDILVPKLKVLLVHYPTGTQATAPTPDQQREMAEVSKYPNEVSSDGDWKPMQASAAAAAREQAGCPLRILACWSPEQKVNVLVGSLDSLPNRPTFVH